MIREKGSLSYPFSLIIFHIFLSFFTVFNYHRRKTSVVRIGNTPLGGDYPIRIQSMTNTSTLDTPASVEQCERIIQAGADYVRLTAQGVREGENLKNIHEALRTAGYSTPLVADIHFNPKAAEAAARYVEKVRINPGNFVDPVKTFKTFEYSEEEYAAEIEKIRTRLLPLLAICREHDTAIRIGVNHGSLSDRIMSRYGDSLEGMVESCMEFLRIFVAENFPDVVISMKSSNTLMMVKSVLLLIKQMEKEGMAFPLHLGVTEAGDGEDGRVKSAVGIGALLSIGVGDTIRVSLSENPEDEIPVARKLRDYILEKEGHPIIEQAAFPLFDPISTTKREARQVKNIGGGMLPVVIAEYCDKDSTDFTPDYWYVGTQTMPVSPSKPCIVDFKNWKKQPLLYPLFSVHEIESIPACESSLTFLSVSLSELTETVLEVLNRDLSIVVILTTRHANGSGEQQAFFHRLLSAGCDVPVVVSREYSENNLEDLQLKAAADYGAVFLDGFGNGIFVKNKGNLPSASIRSCMFSILQAARLRTFKTEYISCPSCGRTLFDLQSTIARIKKDTSHLKDLKIGIMGCIVNGPGEMADADYGYVGSGPGKIDLYKGKEKMEKNIPAEQAVERLIELIKRHGDWKENDL